MGILVCLISLLFLLIFLLVIIHSFLLLCYIDLLHILVPYTESKEETKDRQD
jgi:hypothetical protein